MAEISSPAKANEEASVISALSEELGASSDRSQASDSAQSHTAVEALRSRLNADASDFKPRAQVRQGPLLQLISDPELLLNPDLGPGLIV